MKPLWQLTCTELNNGALALARCPQCGGSGATSQRIVCFDGDALTEVEQPVACDCRRQAVECLAKANLPGGRFQTAALGDLDWSAVQPVRTATALQRYAERLPDMLAHGLGLTLTGHVGAGKTHLAIGLVRLACALGVAARFYTLPDLLARLKATYGGDDDHRRARRESEADVLDELSAAPLLALDDLGVAKPTDWLRDRLYSLVDARYVAGRPVISTANEDLPTLARYLGQRVVSRLAGASLQVTCEGQDYRLRARDRQLERLGLGWAELWSQSDGR